MNQRQLKGERVFIPEFEDDKPIEPTRESTPDTLVFDKADQVEKVEDLRLRLTALDKEIAELDAKVKAAEGDEAEKIQETVFLRQRIRERLVDRIAEIEKKVGE
jgi:hypothetical protein